MCQREGGRREEMEREMELGDRGKKEEGEGREKDAS